MSAPHLSLSSFAIQVLSELDWKNIHQSELVHARLCDAYRFFELVRDRQTRSIHIGALFGTVLHEAVAQYGTSEFGASDWYSLLCDALDKRREMGSAPAGDTAYVYEDEDTGEKRRVTEDDLSEFAIKMIQPLWGGYTLSDVVVEIRREVKAWAAQSGEPFCRIDREIHIQVPVLEQGLGLESEISLGGTLDFAIQVSRNGKNWRPWGILDLKSWGLWSPIFGKSVKKADTFLGSWDPQLLHYTLLAWLKYGSCPERVGFVLPVNMIPYKVGTKKGERRGLVLQAEPVNQDLVRHYAAGLMELLEAWTQVRPRRYPYERFSGQSFCAKCPHRTPCLGGSPTDLAAAPPVDTSVPNQELLNEYR